MSPHRQCRNEASTSRVFLNLLMEEFSSESARGSDESTIRESYRYTSPAKYSIRHVSIFYLLCLTALEGKSTSSQSG